MQTRISAIHTDSKAGPMHKYNAIVCVRLCVLLKTKQSAYNTQYKRAHTLSTMYGALILHIHSCADGANAKKTCVTSLGQFSVYTNSVVVAPRMEYTTRATLGLAKKTQKEMAAAWTSTSSGGSAACSHILHYSNRIQRDACKLCNVSAKPKHTNTNTTSTYWMVGIR